MNPRADVLVIGGGLAGLVAACEAADAGASVLVLDQEGEQNLGGQAFWSLGGLFLVDSPEQRRLRIHDSLELAQKDWEAAAGFDRPEDHWGRRWASATLDSATALALPSWPQLHAALIQSTAAPRGWTCEPEHILKGGFSGTPLSDKRWKRPSLTVCGTRDRMQSRALASVQGWPDWLICCQCPGAVQRLSPIIYRNLSYLYVLQ